MLLSKTSEYGIRAAISITRESLKGRRTSLKNIAAEIGSPEAFTAKVLQQLAKHSIVNSAKGANGGFEIEEKKARKIKLIDVIKAVDSEVYDKGCILGLNVCSEKNPCPMHFRFSKIKTELIRILKSTSLYELSLQPEGELYFLKSNTKKHHTYEKH
ncbi:MAG TPA: Rrf2 family transcriptional regulator [Bacteroidia bacterium]|nr:Rrf2 family transcriptional regulator [Bacteroidia bacterium]